MENPEVHTEDNNLRFIVESALAKQDRSNRRMFIMNLVLILALVCSITLLVRTYTGWLAYMDSFETVTTATQTIEQEADGDGGNYIGSFVGGDYNGEIETKSNNDNN